MLKHIVTDKKYFSDFTKVNKSNEQSKVNAESKIINYKYAVESEATMLLVGTDFNDPEEVPGWNIYLVKYSIWTGGHSMTDSETKFPRGGDIVVEHKTTITSTTKEDEVNYLIDIVKHSAVFTLAFELGIDHFKVYDMFINRKPKIGKLRNLSKGE